MIREILEKNTNINKTLLREFDNVPFKLTENDEFMVLMIFVVKFDDRHQGVGSKFMKRLIELAKEANKDIFLSPSDEYAEKSDMNKNQLIKWYKKLGFKKKQKSDFRSQNTYCYYMD